MFNLPTHVTATNWRRVRLAWMNRTAELGLNEQADAFWNIRMSSWSAPNWALDEELCAQAVADEILRTITAAQLAGVDL